jgi:TRAP-type C4-dicarboxylate transport system substrate-binding protein
MLRVAGYQGPSSILTQGLACLVKTLKSDGWKSDIDWIPNVTDHQEKAADLFASIENGSRHIGYMASGYLSARVPELEVLELPFTVDNRETALSALDRAAGEILTKAVGEKTGFHVLGFWDNGFRHLSNAVRPIQSPTDAIGLKVRTLDSTLYRATLDAMGFQALTSDVKDLVAWIQQDVVQAQENPLTNYMGFELWKHHPYVSLTHHFYGVLLLVCPTAWYDTLDQEERQLVALAVNTATALQRQLAAEQDAITLVRMQDIGVKVLNKDALDMQAFHKCVGSISSNARAQIPADLIAAYLGS